MVPLSFAVGAAHASFDFSFSERDRERERNSNSSPHQFGSTVAGVIDSRSSDENRNARRGFRSLPAPHFFRQKHVNRPQRLILVMYTVYTTREASIFENVQNTQTSRQAGRQHTQRVESTFFGVKLDNRPAHNKRLNIE